MPIIVQKYGGSSVQDLDKVRLVAKKVCAAKKEGNDVVVVVSAMGKTTNELIDLAKQLTEAPSRRELDMLLTTGERITSALLSIAIHSEGFDIDRNISYRIHCICMQKDIFVTANLSHFRQRLNGSHFPVGKHDRHKDGILGKSRLNLFRIDFSIPVHRDIRNGKPQLF